MWSSAPGEGPSRQRPLYQDKLVENADRPSQMQRGGMNGFGVRRRSKSAGIGRAVTAVAAERSAATAKRLMYMVMNCGRRPV